MINASEAKKIAMNTNSGEYPEDRKKANGFLEGIYSEITAAAESGRFRIELKYYKDRPNMPQYQIIRNELSNKGFSISSVIERCLDGAMILKIEWS